MNHMDKIKKHLDENGEITVPMPRCTHPDKINDYCSSDCPEIKGANNV